MLLIQFLLLGEFENLVIPKVQANLSNVVLYQTPQRGWHVEPQPRPQPRCGPQRGCGHPTHKWNFIAISVGTICLWKRQIDYYFDKVLRLLLLLRFLGTTVLFFGKFTFQVLRKVCDLRTYITMLGHSRYKCRISGSKCEYVESACLVLFKECKVIVLLLVQ